jgi:hypothetical protein
MAKAVLLWWFLLALIWALPGPAAFAQDEPPLPEGLGSEGPPQAEEPSLPPGLALPETGAGAEPALWEGLGKEAHEGEPEAVKQPVSRLPFELSGFWEARLGFRTQEDPHQKDVSIGETRLQLQAEKYWERTAGTLTADLLYDPVVDRHAVDLEDGQGFLDLREANLAFTPTSFLDAKVGRQILTWGTGDLIFINDLFPKDWNSFFIGRDEEYLKAPSDAVKVSVFTAPVNLDVVYTPRFDSDRFIDGRRISYYNSALGRLAGRDAIVEVEKPDDWFSDDELAARLYSNVRGYEVAAYAYRGFWKGPAGTNPQSGKATFPSLSVYGASVRGSILRGIGSTEFGYYDSEDDPNGDDPFIRNSELRFLVGYEQEVAKEFTVGVQYYLEYMLHYDDYRRTLPAGTPPADEDRHVLTVRLTKLLMNQNLKLSLFTFYSPSDRDAYLRANIHYKLDDHWAGEIGGNVFVGEEDHTFFGQFKKNSNVYVGVRYSF